MKLQNKVAIITGAGSGIGKSTALIFAKEGAKVVVANRREDKGQNTVDEIKKQGGEAMFIKTDVSNWDDVSNMVERVVQSYGEVDILVNNAGVLRMGPLTEVNEDDWNYVLNINLKGVFYTMKKIIPLMIKQGKGKIINIASIAGLVGFEQIGPYCASKGGVIALTREAALEYAKNKININCIAPGVIRTEMTGMLEDEQTNSYYRLQTPYPRLGEGEDIGYAALYLASDESDFMTGQVMVVDGGWTIK
ncbi:MAG: beta-ketoacyl-ACP reductase [Patescibacteria group bacterium]|nr:MAG: beta-ketoacyl-ACP reductase [Patescibacteria group bacterium]